MTGKRCPLYWVTHPEDFVIFKKEVKALIEGEGGLTVTQYEELKKGVNPVRLKNHPVALDVESIDALYGVIK